GPPRSRSRRPQPTPGDHDLDAWGRTGRPLGVDAVGLELSLPRPPHGEEPDQRGDRGDRLAGQADRLVRVPRRVVHPRDRPELPEVDERSEERRVGKEWRWRRW